MRMGRDWPDMFRVVHGEGHPYLWYIILKAAFDLFGTKLVLPVAGFVIGVAAVAVLVFRGPFRIGVLALMIFSMHLGFEYVVMARNYGMAGLAMLVIAWLWPRIRDSLWLGVLLLVLCNTNVPAIFMAGGLFLYRILELWSEERRLSAPEWRLLAANGLLMLAGVLLCFLAVYPPANDSASSTNAKPLTIINILAALFTSSRSFIDIGFGHKSLFGQLAVWLSLLVFFRRPKALIAALAAMLTLKLFSQFVYPGYYRHAAQFFILTFALLWIEGRKRLPSDDELAEPDLIRTIGLSFFSILMLMQTVSYVHGPVRGTLQGSPYSEAGELAAILKRPEFAKSWLLIDPDTMGEAVAFQIDRPYWLTRQNHPATVTPLALNSDKHLTLDRLIEEAAYLHAKSGKPVIIALGLPLKSTPPGQYDVMYADYTVITPENVARFRAATRPVAELRHAWNDENYDVYVYPR
jgi:hypothetical protein